MQTLKEYVDNCTDKVILSGIHRAITALEDFEVETSEINDTWCIIGVKHNKSKSSALIRIPMTI